MFVTVQRSLFVRAFLVAIAALFLVLLGGCRKMNGRLTATVKGEKVTMGSAYAVSKGGKSFRVVALEKKSSCAALLGAPGATPPAGVRVDFVVAPILDERGKPSWGIARERVQREPGDALIAALGPAIVEGPARCPSRIALAAARDIPARREDDEVLLDGDFRPECCTAQVPEVTDAPMMARAGTEAYPLTRASWAERPNEDVTVRITGLRDPCDPSVEGDDLTLTLTLEPKTLKLKAAFPRGRVVHDGLQIADENLHVDWKDGVLVLRGFMEMRRMTRDGPWIPLNIDGRLPTVTCPR